VSGWCSGCRRRVVWMSATRAIVAVLAGIGSALFSACMSPPQYGIIESLPPGKDKSYTLSPEEVARRNADASACNEQVGESSPTPLLTDCMKAKGWNYVIVEVLVR